MDTIDRFERALASAPHLADRFAIWVKTERKNQGMTRLRLAKAVGKHWTARSIEWVEERKTELSYTSSQALCCALGHTFGDVMKRLESHDLLEETFSKPKKALKK